MYMQRERIRQNEEKDQSHVITIVRSQITSIRFTYFLSIVKVISTDTKYILNPTNRNSITKAKLMQ